MGQCLHDQAAFVSHASVLSDCMPQVQCKVVLWCEGGMQLALSAMTTRT